MVKGEASLIGIDFWLEFSLFEVHYMAYIH